MKSLSLLHLQFSTIPLLGHIWGVRSSPKLGAAAKSQRLRKIFLSVSQINPSPGVDLPWSHVEYFVKLQAQVRDQWNSVSGMSPVCSCPHRSPWPPKPSTPHHPSPTQWPQHANCIHLEATPINSTSTGYRPHKASYGTSSPLPLQYAMY